MNTTLISRRSFLCRSILLAAAALGAGPLISSALAGGWSEGQKLPDLKSFGLEGALPSTSGQVILLDFWASWCGPCKESFPVLNKWQQTYSKQGFSVIAVSVDDDKAAMAAFAKKVGVSFPILHDAAHKLVAAASVATMPTSILIDRKGKIRHVHTGFRSKDVPDMVARIEALLAEK